MVDDFGVMLFVYKWQVSQQMMKPGNGGYNASGDCEKGLGGLLTAWAFVLVRIREIWKIGRAVIGYFSRSGVMVGFLQCRIVEESTA
ncbi:hypothetical protein [Escherichia coli]|uniref:hypothetical protein n=1 Tax=Escherichia coli TaxID=562 RepID=UPI002979C5FD|nr:hypothetical protein [Escherichia coli]